MHDIEEYILNSEGNRKEIIRILHNILITFPQVSGKIKYKVPFYEGRSWLCYMNNIKKDGIELVFVRGSELSEMFPILDKKSRKIVAGITFFNSEEIPELKIAEITTEALRLDSTKGSIFKEGFDKIRERKGKYKREL